MLNELEANDPLQNPEAAIKQFRNVFDRMLTTGEQSRTELWSQLRRMTALDIVDYVESASEFVETRQAKMSEAALPLDDILCAYGGRLQTFDSDTVLEKGLGDRFINILQTFELEDEHDESAEEPESLRQILPALVIQWSSEEATSQLAVKLMEYCYSRLDMTAALQHWGQSLLSTLPKACRTWLAASYDRLLTEGHRQYVVSQLDVMHTQDDISEEQENFHSEFIFGLTEQALADSQIKTYTAKLFLQIAQRYANPNNYLYRVFPVVQKWSLESGR
jgi:hypothetical protein